MGIPFSDLPDYLKNKIHPDDLAALRPLYPQIPIQRHLPSPPFPDLLLNEETPHLGLQTRIPGPLQKTPKSELTHHSIFQAWIKRHNKSQSNFPILSIHADPTQPSTITPGWPDFSLFYLASVSPPLFIEFKAGPKAKWSNPQLLFKEILKKAGYHYFTAFNSTQAIEVTKNLFQLP